uniref:Primary cilia formation n=1 Tax=Phasianus colchicus TaxID=9054 RepID=A0A669QQG8_PHACC
DCFARILSTTKCHSANYKKMFPLHHAPNEMGIQLAAIRGKRFLGPGCYLQKVSLFFILRAFLSQKTYTIGTVTPGPGTYQPLWNKERKRQLNCAPFSSKTPRFPDKPPNKELFPGPGTYDAEKRLHKKITWPMKFGSPDWSLVPMPAKRMLKTELIMDREFRKHRNRVAYLSLYEN